MFTGPRSHFLPKHALLSLLGLCLHDIALAQGCVPPWCNPGVPVPDPNVTTLHEDYYSAIHARDVGYKVMLPPAYGADTTVFHPLILLFPGYGSTELFGISSEWLTSAMVSGELPWSVIVHVNPVGNSFWHDGAANTSTADTVQGYSLIVDELIPHLLNTYRISRDPATHAAVGFSMGGYGALNVALRSGLFRSVLSVDGAVRVPGNESAAFQYACFNDPTQVAQHNLFNMLGSVGLPPALQAAMILTATNGVTDNLLFHQELVAAGLNSNAEFIPGLPHDMEAFVAVRDSQMVAFLAQHLHVPDAGYLTLHAALQGALVPGTGAMHAMLRDQGLLPSTEPYSALGYALVGGGGEVASMEAMTDSGLLAITDWVVVELRSANDPALVIHSFAALLRRNGLVTDANGNEVLVLPVPAGTYHVSLRHRNHLGVMTAQPWIIQPNQLPVLDLTAPGTALSGGSEATINIDGANCLWAGDVTGNGRVSYLGSGNDRDQQLVSVGGTNPVAQVSGYLQGDVNLDGVLRYMGAQNDRDIILQNIGGTVPTAIRIDHLP